MKETNADKLQRFILHCSSYLKENSICNMKIYMKKLLRYLEQSGHIVDTYEVLLSFPVSVERKIQPAIPQEEISAILVAPDRNTPEGKRDYAIIILGVVTGLRAGDIAKLKLADIDWRKGEIRIIQDKTDKSLALPLTKDVGEAIRDYILNGRPQSVSKNVFLRTLRPFQPLTDGVAIRTLYNKYRSKVGLPRKAFDGKNFHALRRSIGRNMATSNVPVTMIAQVLGHSGIDTAKKYISLDITHLKECALDFTGIAPDGGAI